MKYFIFMFIANFVCQFFLTSQTLKSIYKVDAIGTHVYDRFLLLLSVKYMYMYVAWFF